MYTLPKILIVDDEPDILEDVCRFLKMSGYTVITANNGKGALHQVVTEKPDLVLLDIRMPEMDGLECLRQMKEINPDLSIIMVTCITDMDTAKKAMELGAVDYITKPLNLESLETIILTHSFLKSAK